MEVRLRCKCGAQEAPFNLRDNVMPPEVILELYCPACSPEVSFDPECMIKDNGWYIEYDMDLARFMAVAKLGLPPEKVTPEFLFDEGYATWKELYPGEHQDIKEEKEAIVALLEIDPQRYFQEIRRWALNHVEKLKAQGWRKAQNL